MEEARHQGYSAADMAAEMQEREKRMQDLGCFTCKYQQKGFATCEVILNGEDTYPRCPYRKEE